MAQSTQVWFCEKCLVVGAVVYDEHAGVFEVSNQIRGAHLKYRPKCKFSERVIVPQNIHKDTILCTGRE